MFSPTAFIKSIFSNKAVMNNNAYDYNIRSIRHSELEKSVIYA